MGVACYLPLRRNVRHSGPVKRISQVPLFPGYVFLWGTIDDAYLADRTQRVASLIRVPDPERLEWELRNIHRALSTAAPLDPHDALRVGLRARVATGPCAGVEGLIASRSRLDRLVLQVNMLGTAVCLEVDAGLVELLDG
jgi:transcriptional antiterminator RfaH